MVIGNCVTLLLRWLPISSTAGNAINASTRLFDSNVGKQPLYWLHSLVLVVLTGFGGGILAPIMIGKPALPFSNEAIVPLCILAWYLTHYAGLQKFFTWLPVKIVW